MDHHGPLTVERGTSLVIQWLRLWALSAGTPGSIPGQATRFHMPQLKKKNILCADTKTQCSQIIFFFLMKKGRPRIVKLAHHWWALPVGTNKGAAACSWVHGDLGYRLWGQTSCEVKWKSLSCVQLFVTPWTIQSMEFSRPEYWKG